MCSIAGIVGLGRVNAEAVSAMSDLMAHRGPDGDGLWSNGNGRVCFGHRRLAIIDLSHAADQPMSTTDGSLTITYNGEISNYQELRNELISLGSRFGTKSDTEVILHAYRTWGDKCVERFNGMFAFAIWDDAQKRLFCARDRFGEKPFLFTGTKAFFAFASEYKALLALEGVADDIDETRLLSFCVDPTASLDQGMATVFPGIGELPAGHILSIDGETLEPSVSAYWQPPTDVGTRDDLDFAEASEEMRALITSSVQLRMRADVPVGSCLSGGLDSGTIAGLARGFAGEGHPYHVFTGRFPGSEADEGDYADAIVAATGVTQHEVFPTGKGLLDELVPFIWLNELPVDSASQYAQWSVFKCANENGITVLLDGQGGDEVLAGYEQYFAAYKVSRLTDGQFDAAEEGAIRDRYPLAFSMTDQSWKTRLPLPLLRMASKMLGRGSNPLFGIRLDAAMAIAKSRTNDPRGLHDALIKDATSGFLATLLRYGDRNSMAHSREVRLPFCDHRIFEFAISMPAEFLMGNAETKRLLRGAAEGVLPDQVRTRWRKQGFLPPIETWLDGPLGGLVRDVFNSPSFADSGLWNVTWWQGLLDRFQAGERHLASVIWKPFSVEMWRRHFLTPVRDMPKYPPLR